MEREAGDQHSALQSLALARVERDLGTETAQEVVRAFLDALPGRLTDLVDGDDGVRRRSAHSLKSGAALVGAGRLATAAAAVEAGGTDHADVASEADVAALALRRWLAGRLGH